MAKLSDEEAAQLKALQDKSEAPDEPTGGGGNGVILLMGSRADAFLSQVLGPAPAAAKKTAAPAKKAAAPAKKTAAPAATDDNGGDDDDGGDDDGAGDEPPAVHRFFR